MHAAVVGKDEETPPHGNYLTTRIKAEEGRGQEIDRTRRRWNGMFVYSMLNVTT
jgi:hypothetical protein